MAVLNVLYNPVCFPRFVDYLEQRVPADDSSRMSLVFESLVQKFLNVEQYANDIRYVKYCIKCVSLPEVSDYDSAVTLQQLNVILPKPSHKRLFILSYRQVFILTLWHCSVTSTVRALAPGPRRCTWPGRSILNRGGCMNRPKLCTRKQWRTKPSPLTLFSASTGNHTGAETSSFRGSVPSG